MATFQLHRSGLSLYADDHSGRFPYHTNGFGDAYVAWMRNMGFTNQSDARIFTAPDDDASVLIGHLRNQTHMPEDACTRAYVQGLNQSNKPDICLIFDRYPTPGGDHFRRPGGPLLREVCMHDGSMVVVPETDWPAFRAKQIELLLAAGISRATAEKLYAPFPRPRR